MEQQEPKVEGRSGLPEVIDQTRKELLEAELNKIVGGTVAKVVVGPFKMVTIQFEDGTMLTTGSDDIEVL